MDRFDKEICQYVAEYINNYTKKHEEINQGFLNLISNLGYQKNILEKSKNVYFESSKEFCELEKKIKKVKDNPNFKEDLPSMVSNMLKQKNKVEIDCDNYKTKVSHINFFFKENEITYHDIFNDFINNEEEKNIFAKDVTLKVINIVSDLSQNQTAFINQLNDAVSKINIKHDSKIISNRFDNFIANSREKIRFVNEDFLDYDYMVKTSIKSTDSKEKTNSHVKSNSNLGGGAVDNYMLDTSNDNSFIFEREFLETNNTPFCRIDINYKIAEDDEPIVINGSNKYDELTDKIINSNEPISIDEINNLITTFDKKKNSIQEFIGSLFSHYISNNYVEVKCLENLHHLAHFLILCVSNNDILSLNFLIFYIAEKTVYNNKENIFNKCFLCNIVSQNKAFKNKNLWSKLIELRVAYVLNRTTLDEIERREKISNVSETKNVLKKMKFMFSNWKMKENRKIENEILYNKIINDKVKGIAVQIIQDYIQHFTNFKLPITDALEIIVNLSFKYKFAKEYVNLFNSMLNTFSFSVKTKKAILEDIAQEVDYRKYTDKFIPNEELLSKEKSLVYIANSLKYNSTQDMFQLLSVNKEFNQKLKKVICRNLLLKNKDIDNEVRIHLWKIILNYNETKKSCNYKEMQVHVEEYVRIKSKYESKEIIAMDVLRTPFDSNVQENREKILRILRSISYKCTHTTYCQGMNYIAAFILNLVKDEEEAFYIYLSLLNSTEYGEIFTENLTKMKKYFYMIDRLLITTMPELYLYLKMNNITVSYFCSPWLITLFTNCFQYLQDKNNPKVLLRIWDFFLLEGWMSILHLSLSLIKHFESKILELSYEELLVFLINDMIKKEFFQNQNLEKVMFIQVNLTIEKGLIKSILEEYEIKKKVGLPIE